VRGRPEADDTGGAFTIDTRHSAIRGGDHRQAVRAGLSARDVLQRFDAAVQH
jgi:hypothetical protein